MHLLCSLLTPKLRTIHSNQIILECFNLRKWNLTIKTFDQLLKLWLFHPQSLLLFLLLSPFHPFLLFPLPPVLSVALPPAPADLMVDAEGGGSGSAH